jgi:hypothetical protein
MPKNCVVNLKMLNNFVKISLTYFKFYAIGSRIRKKIIPDPGSLGKKRAGSRIRNTAEHVSQPWETGDKA